MQKPCKGKQKACAGGVPCVVEYLFTITTLNVGVRISQAFLGTP